MKKILLACLALIGLLSACSTEDDLETNKTKTSTTVIDSNYVYELPVVFHVLYQNASDDRQYVPSQRLADILSYVNRIYVGLDFGKSENIRVKFVLAKKDPQGKTLAQPGMDYFRYTGEYPIDPEKFLGDNTGTNTGFMWEPNDYINIYMFNFKRTSNEGELLGLTTMPFCMDTHKIEGLTSVSAWPKKDNLRQAVGSCINSLYAMKTADGESYYQSNRYTEKNPQRVLYYANDIAVTIAHELGHYLGLHHVFTEHKNSTNGYEPVDSCGDTDFCEDTPSYNRIEYNNFLTYVMENNEHLTMDDVATRYSCDSLEYTATNIMDYNWTLGYEISKDQKERMRQVLYYSPLIPGPKKDHSSRATRAAKGILPLKTTIIK